VWNQVHGDCKFIVEGAFTTHTLVPPNRDAILVRLDFQGHAIVQSELLPVPLSAQRRQAEEAMAKFQKRRRLNTQEKQEKAELQEIMNREEGVQEREQTVAVIDAICAGAEVRFS